MSYNNLDHKSAYYVIDALHTFARASNVLVIRNNCKEVIVCICESDRDELTQRKEGHSSQYRLHYQPHECLDEFPFYNETISNG
jgi:hypothetical protein